MNHSMKEATIRNDRQVRRALEKARVMARERELPLTPERIAACLGISRARLQEYIEGTRQAEHPSGLVRGRVQALLAQAWRDCNAELAEELLRPGSHSGAVFLGKNNFGYTDKAEPPEHGDVVFVGEPRP